MTIAKSLEDLEVAKRNVGRAILKEMSLLAIKFRLECMEFTGWENRYYEEEGILKECPPMDELDDLYCEHVNRRGFTGTWTYEKGWQ